MKNLANTFNVAEIVQNTPEWMTVAKLRDAWLGIKGKNKSGGIDQQNITDYQRHIRKNLRKLSQKLIAQTYIPQPEKKIFIPKGKGEERPIGLSTIEDKIVQTAIRAVIEPVFEPMFLDCSYAYRPGKGHRSAIEKVEYFIQNNKFWVLRCDIDNFFDEISHEILLRLLAQHLSDKYILKLIEMWLTIGGFDGGNYVERTAGVPQGSVIAPLLSNLYLHKFDQMLVNRKVNYVRYADDFIIFCKSEEAARDLLRQCENFLIQKLKLRLNPDKKRVVNIVNGFTFLGIRFTNGLKQIAPEKQQKAVEKIDRIFGKAIKRPFHELINEINDAVEGWKYYYGDCQNDIVFRNLQEKIWKKLCYTIYRLREEEEIPETNWLNGNLNRLKLLVDISAHQRKSVFNQILSGVKRLKLPWSNVTVVQKRQARRPVNEKALAEDTTPGQTKRRLAASRQKYIRMFAAAHDLVLSDFGLFIGKRGQRLLIRPKNGEQKQVAINKLKHIIVLNTSVTFSTAAIELCANNNIPIDFLDNFGRPFARLAAPDAPAWRFGLNQLDAQNSTKGVRIACEIVEAKIKNQQNLIKYFGKYRRKHDPEFAKHLAGAIVRFENYLEKTKALRKVSDSDSVSQSLFGYEGQAAGDYWQLVKMLVESNVIFEGRVGRGATDELNVLLNYGYGVLYARVWGALMLAGLNPQISFLHKAQYGKPTLVFDIIEPFRAPVIDRTVISMINREEKFTLDEKGYLTRKSKNNLVKNIFERLNTPVNFRGKKVTLQEVLHLTCADLGKFLNGKKTKFKPYIMKW